MPVKRGDKVAVITRSLCRYEGYYLSVNAEKQTFTLVNVKAFGTENRQAEEHYPSVQSTYQCLEFNASGVEDLRVIDRKEFQDPAIVNVGEHRRQNDRYERNTDYFRSSSRELGSRGRSYASQSYGNRSYRNDWLASGSQSDGSFPRRNPGAQGNSLEEFDFEEGIKEFNQLKLNDSTEDADPEKQSPETSPEKKSLPDDEAAILYDKQKSFFDNLSGTGVMAPRKAQFYPRMNNPNVETFGADTVQQLYEIRRHTNDQRHGYRSRDNYRRYNNRNSNGSMMSYSSRGRQNFGPFSNAVHYH